MRAAKRARKCSTQSATPGFSHHAMHDPNQIFKQTNDGFHPRPRPEIRIYIPLARRRDDHHRSAAHRRRENSEKREVQQQVRDGVQGEVPLLPCDASCGGRPAGDGARRRGVRPRPRGQDGAEAGPVRGGHAEPARRGAAQLLCPGARHRPQPEVPLRRHAVQHRAPGRRQARRGHDHPQALRHRQPPHRLQMRP